MDDVAKLGLKHLRRRGGDGGVFYYARRVPSDLVEAFGDEYITPVSLRTADPKLVESRWLEQHAYWEARFDELRAQISAGNASEASWDEIVAEQTPIHGPGTEPQPVLRAYDARPAGDVGGT